MIETCERVFVSGDSGYDSGLNPKTPNSPKHVLFVDFRPKVGTIYLYTWSLRARLGARRCSGHVAGCISADLGFRV